LFTAGVYVATGHGPWGISLSLGTGLVVAELAQGRPLSADISELGLKMK
jgi:glycine/D-amino acid oxidase-like deaminating enzyme